jgi:hypothetical protein
MIVKLNHSPQPSPEVTNAWILPPRLPQTVMQTLLMVWQWEEELLLSDMLVESLQV